MRAVEYFSLLIKKNHQIWSILQGGIVIPVECICVDQMAL